MCSLSLGPCPALRPRAWSYNVNPADEDFHLLAQTQAWHPERVQLLPWLVWLSLSAGLRTKRSPVRFPVRAHAWAAGQVPSWGHAGGNWQPIDVSLTQQCFSVSLSLSLKIKKKRIKKKESSSCPGFRVAQLVGELPPAPKSCEFDPWSGHILSCGFSP